MTPASQQAPAKSASEPLRVMIVDDSAVVRGLVSRWLNEHIGIEVVGTAANGRIALDMLERARPDVIVLDLDMPEMDGLTALPVILRRDPHAAVLIASTLTKRNAEISMRCLSLGAVDYLPKPDNNRDLSTSQLFRRELVLKIDAIGSAQRRKMPRPVAASYSGGATATPKIAHGHAISSNPVQGAAGRVAPGYPLSPAPVSSPQPLRIRSLMIGASTGGPRAVAQVLAGMMPVLPQVPVLIVQHMPPVFTAVFAEHLRAQTGHEAREPFDGERIVPGTIYVAPGGRHMGLRRVNGNPVIRLDDSPPINFCRPSVDVLFRDAAEIYGASALPIMLTGMGSDGMQGARCLTDAGAKVIAQDEATSTVWGMPGSVVKAGLASKVLPLGEIGPAIVALIGGGQHEQR